MDFISHLVIRRKHGAVKVLALLLALVMIVLIALLFKAEDIFGKDVEG